MIVSLVSSLLGMAGGLLPDIFKEIRESREHTRELERMDKQADLQIKLLEHQTDAKLAEIEGNVMVEEMRAFRDQMTAIYEQQKPTGIRWVDGFNALIRPTTAALLMLMFVAIAGVYAWGIVSKTDWSQASSMTAAATTLWGSLVGEAIQAVLGYLFGYRSTIKVRELTRRK